MRKLRTESEKRTQLYINEQLKHKLRVAAYVNGVTLSDILNCILDTHFSVHEPSELVDSSGVGIPHKDYY